MGGRITTTAWWFFVIILIVSYTASLTNFLRAGPLSDEAEKYSRIRSFADLASNTELSAGMLAGGSTNEYFKMSQAPVEREIYEKVLKYKETNFKSSVAEGVQTVRDSKYLNFAFIMESAMAKYFIQTKPCDLYIVSENLISRHYSLAFQEGDTQLRERINLALLQLQGNGELGVLENKWFSGTCKKTVVEYSEDFYRPERAASLDLGSFSGALLVLAVGIIFGAIVTVVEIAIYRWAEAVSMIVKSSLAVRTKNLYYFCFLYHIYMNFLSVYRFIPDMEVHHGTCHLRI